MRMRPSHHLFLQRDVGVELGAGDRCVAQDRLDVAQVRVIAEHLRGHRVAESVGGYRLGHAAALRRSSYDLSDGPHGKTPAANAHKKSLLFIGALVSQGRTAWRYASVK